MVYHERLQYLLIRAFYSYSAWNGMNSYRYDYVNGECVQTSFSRRLALLVNILTVLVLPVVSWDALKLRSEVFSNRVMLCSHYLNVGVRIVAVLYTVLYRYQREEATRRMAHEIQQLHAHYLRRVPSDEQVEARFNRLFYVKYVSLVYLLASSFISYANTQRKWHWYNYPLILLFTHIMNILYCTMFSYFLALWYTCRSLCYINVQLRHLKDHHQQQQHHHQWSRSLRHELQLVLRVHWRVLQLVRKLSGIYRLQVLALRIVCIVSNVMIGFHLSIDETRASISETLIGFAIITFISTMLDFYLVDLVCHMLPETFEEGALILSDFNAVKLYCEKQQRVLEQLMLQFNCNQERMDTCGLFYIDRRLWFKMFGSIISLTIVLVQFHWIICLNPAFQSEPGPIIEHFQFSAQE